MGKLWNVEQLVECHESMMENEMFSQQIPFVCNGIKMRFFSIEIEDWTLEHKNSLLIFFLIFFSLNLHVFICEKIKST